MHRLYGLNYYIGESAVGFNYVRTRFGWGFVEYSKYNSICNIIDLVGQGILIPLIGYMGIRDTNIIPLLIAATIVRHLIKGLAYNPWMLYLGSAVDLMGGYTFSAAKSAASKCVDINELGKVFALLYSVESIVPMAMTQLYASLWKATSGVPGIGETMWIGSSFFASASITVVKRYLSDIWNILEV